MAPEQEPTGTSAAAGEATPSNVRVLRGPIPVPMWPLGGYYVGCGDSYRLDVMLDVDSARGEALVTIDFHALDGAPGSLIGACTLRAATLSSDGGCSVIRGMGHFTFAAAAPLVELRIERRSVLKRRAPALVSFLSPMLSPGARYLCDYRGSAPRARGSEASPMGSVLSFARPQDGATG